MIKKVATVIDDFSGGQDTRTPILKMTLDKSPNMRNWHCAGVRNRLIKRGGFAKINSSTVESDDLDVFYSPGYQTTDYALRDTAAKTKISQGFKPNTSSTVTKVKLWLKSEGTPGGTDTITLEIQTDSSGVPSGSAVTNGTATAVDISDTLTSSYAWVEFTFSTDPSLTADTQYHLVLSGAFTISAVNYVNWGVDNFDVIYPDGSMSNNDGTTWVTDPLYDACFEVYITDGEKGNDGVALFDFNSKNMLIGVFGASLYKMDKNSAGTPDGTWDAVPGGSDWDTYTKLISNFDGSDAATAFTDPVAGVYTFGGTAQLDTDQKVFGTASLLLDGDSDYVTLPDSDDWDFGTGDFTIDFRYRGTIPAGSETIICNADSEVGNTDGWAIRIDATNLNFVAMYDGSWQLNLAKAHGMVSNTWYHITIARNGTTVTIYKDGVSLGSTTSALDITGSPNLLYIGRDITDRAHLAAWLDEVRISKGIARWTANFTKPAAAYTAGSLSLTSSRYWTFADWQSGRALINTDIGMYTYIGTGNASLVSGAPLGKFIIVWKNYCFSFGIRGSPNNGRYSDLSDYTTWPAGNTFSNAFNTNDGDVITGVRTLKGKLYVFKRYSIHRVSYLGSNPTFQVDQILGLGSPSHYCIKEVDLGGDIGSVLIFLTTDKKLAIFDGYNIQVINENITEETNELFAAADDQPLSFADMDFSYVDLFHAVIKSDTSEYILYTVLSGDTTVGYGFVFDYKTGGIYPYDNQVFSSSIYAVSTSKSRKLYCCGYTGYIWEMESGNDDDGSDINAYWVSGKIKPASASLLSKLLQMAFHFKEVSSGSTLNMNVQYRLDWNTAWSTAEQTNFDRANDYAFGKTAIFDIGTIENMFQIKVKDDSSNPAPTIYGFDLYGQPLGVEVGDRGVS